MYTFYVIYVMPPASLTGKKTQYTYYLIVYKISFLKIIVFIEEVCTLE